MRELLRAALTAAVAGDGQALADTMDPDVTAWDAVGGTVTGASAAATALIALLASAGAEPGTSAVSIRTGDGTAAVAEIDTAATRLAVVAHATASGDRLAEIRSYADPAELHR